MPLVHKPHVDRMMGMVLPSFSHFTTEAGVSMKQIAALLDVSTPTAYSYIKGTAADFRAASNMMFLTEQLRALGEDGRAKLKAQTKARQAFVVSLLGQ